MTETLLDIKNENGVVIASIVKQYHDNSDVEPDFYDIFDNDGNCLNEGFPLYSSPSVEQVEIILAKSDLISSFSITSDENIEVLRQTPNNTPINLSFGSEVKMLAPFDLTALDIIMESRFKQP
jgi:hypothetical protein